MNEFINKLIERLEEEKQKDVSDAKFYRDTKNEKLCIAYTSKARAFQDAIEIVNQLAEEYNNGWIPFTQRELTEEEKEEMNTDFDYMLDCKLPDDNQEIIVSYKNGYVDTDTFFNDCGECYLDSGNDFIDDAVAWMPLPAPYQPKGEQ